MVVLIYLVDVFTFKIMTLPPKTQSQLIADVNLLYMQKRITEAERLRQIFSIRERYEKKTDDILINPDNLCEK